MDTAYATMEEALAHCTPGFYVDELYGLGWFVLPIERVA